MGLTKMPSGAHYISKRYIASGFESSQVIEVETLTKLKDGGWEQYVLTPLGFEWRKLAGPAGSALLGELWFYGIDAEQRRVGIPLRQIRNVKFLSPSESS